jgi:hypothetical protein
MTIFTQAWDSSGALLPQTDTSYVRQPQNVESPWFLELFFFSTVAVGRSCVKFVIVWFRFFYVPGYGTPVYIFSIHDPFGM